MATVFAVGLGLSATFYPLPARFDFPASPSTKRDVSADPSLDPPRFGDYRITNTAAFRMSDLVQFVHALEGHTLDIPPNTVVDLVNRYGLPEVARSLDLLRSMQVESQSYPIEDRRGAGQVGPDTFPALVTLLEYILEILPRYSGPELSEIMAKLVPAVVESLRAMVTPGASPIDTQAFTLRHSQIAITPPVPVPVPAPAHALPPAPATTQQLSSVEPPPPPQEPTPTSTAPASPTPEPEPSQQEPTGEPEPSEDQSVTPPQDDSEGPDPEQSEHPADADSPGDNDAGPSSDGAESGGPQSGPSDGD